MANHIFNAIFDASPDDQKALFLETVEGHRISYEEFFASTARAANALIDLGVTPGDRVAVQVQKSPEALFLCYAIMRAGAVLLPLNTDYRPREIRYFLEDAEPALTICMPEKLEEISAFAGELGLGASNVLTLDADGTGSFSDKVNTSSSDDPDISRGKDDLAAILYTSGTTGRSKGAMITHNNLISNAKALASIWHFTRDDHLLHALPIFHTHGLFTATNTILMSGASMLFLPKFDAEKVVRLLPSVTTMMGIPTFYSRLVAHPDFNSELVKNIRLFISGSAPLSADVHKAFKERTGHAILERYGMTETNMNTSNPYDGDRRPGTVGMPLPGVEIRLGDLKTNAPLKEGDVGVIQIKGPNVFKGYWRMQDKTAESFCDDGFFISGDMGKIDEEGYIHIVGRDKDLIISGGFNVYPAEVEAVLSDIPAIAEAAVIGLPHADFGEAVTAVIALNPETTLSEKDILSTISDELAGYKRPKRILFVESLPRNTMGKIQKTELRSRYSDTYNLANN